MSYTCAFNHLVSFNLFTMSQHEINNIRNFSDDETNDSDDNSGQPGSSNPVGLSMPELDEVAPAVPPQDNPIEDEP